MMASSMLKLITSACYQNVNFKCNLRHFSSCYKISGKGISDLKLNPNVRRWCHVPSRERTRGKGWGFAKAGLIFGGATVVGFCASEIKRAAVVNALEKPELEVKPSKSIVFRDDNHGLKLVLYQYQTCPFCCKVRAFLDFNGISYDVVEVDPVMRQQIKFSKWRKVPILLIKQRQDPEYQQLNDSSLIVSVLQSHLLNPLTNIEELSNFYPSIEYKNEKGKDVTEILNKYHIMHGTRATFDEHETQNELKWRMWADEILVHTLSPNVYRTPGEALQAFKWFSQVGEWEKHFPLWERLMVIYVGATAMYLIGKRLKKRHNLDDDVRISLYKACDEWVEAIGTQKPFMGGKDPNLSDLAVFGVLNSIEGCTAFGDLLHNSKIQTWFYQMKALTSGGSNRLTSPSSSS